MAYAFSEGVSEIWERNRSREWRTKAVSFTSSQTSYSNLKEEEQAAVHVVKTHAVVLSILEQLPDVVASQNASLARQPHSAWTAQ